MRGTSMLPLVAVVSCLLVPSMAYPTGPPIAQFPELCRDMFPALHNASAQTVPAPFNVSITCHCYVPGGHIYVDYKVWPNHDPLEGIFMQARSSAGDIRVNMAVGSFQVDPNKAMNALNCNGNTASATGHTAEVKEVRKGSCWKVPDNLGGANVKFVATALLHTKEFWTFVESQEIGPCPNGATPTSCLAASAMTDAAFCDDANVAAAIARGELTESNAAGRPHGALQFVVVVTVLAALTVLCNLW